MSEYMVSLRIEHADGVIAELYEVKAESFSMAKKAACIRAMNDFKGITSLEILMIFGVNE